MAASRTAPGCVESRVVSTSTRVQLIFPALALTAAVSLVGFGGVWLKAQRRGTPGSLLLFGAVIGAAIVVISFAAQRERMRDRSEFARFLLAEEDRRKLSLPDMKPPPSAWNGGSWFALRCEGDRVQLAKGTMTLEIGRLGVVPTLLLTKGGKVIGVDLARGDVVLRKRAGGPGRRYLATASSHT